MITLFNTPNYKIDTKKFSNLLHDEIVEKLEQNFAKYVGAKYACTGNSASSLLFLSLLRYNRNAVVSLPSIIPPVVPNVVVNTGNKIYFYDNIEWVGSCYHLYDDIYDSAQQVSKNQYADLNKDDSIMVFSFYPTKPVGSCDGGIVVSNNKKKIDYFKMMTMNGVEFDTDSWKRTQLTAGYKMHCNSIQAYIANENLFKLDEKNSKLDEIKSMYNDAFGYNNTSRHLYRIRVNDNNEFINKMKTKDIQCGIHYQSCHHKEFYDSFYSQPLPLSEQEEKSTVSLPFHEKLTHKQVIKVIKNVKNFQAV